MMRAASCGFLPVFLCCLIGLADATVVLKPISVSFADLPAKSAVSVNKHGVCGALYLADPKDGCSSLRNNVVSNRTEQRTRFVLIARGECSFEDKIQNAQDAGFQAAIVYDNSEKENLVYMIVKPVGITVHAVFVSRKAGEILRRNRKGEDGECCIYPPENIRAWTVLVISLFSLVLIIGILLIGFVVQRRWVQWRGRSYRPTSVDAKVVENLPRFTYYVSWSSQCCSGETCAICLEDFRDGESLRLLPCQHAFHLSCVDSWLTKWGTFCPVCKLDIRASNAVSEVNRRICPRGAINH